VQAQLQRVAAIAPHGHTAFVHGFLSDGAHMIFVRVDARYNAERQTAVLSTRSESEPFELAAGLGHLNAWLAAEPASLGFVSPTIELDGSGTSVTLTEALGMGATSMVYAAEHTRGTGAPGELPARFVVKLFQPTVPGEALRGEAEALRACAALPNVVQLHGISERSRALVLTPLCATSFSLHAFATDATLLSVLYNVAGRVGATTRPLRPRAADFCDLVDALRALHGQGYVHRDPRPQNFFRDGNGAFVLSDLGAAVRIGTRPDPSRPFGFTYGPLRVLERLAVGAALGPVSPGHDLEQVARIVLAGAAGVSVSAGASPGQLLAAWRAADEAILGRPLDDPARCLLELVVREHGDGEGAAEVDPDALKNAIRRVVPV
jgi:hypothetical protein